MIAEVPKTTTIYEINFKHIPTQLRRMADEIEAGKYGDVEDAVFVLETTKVVEVFGWGQAVAKSSIGLLQLGIAKLCRIWHDSEQECA